MTEAHAYITGQLQLAAALAAIDDIREEYEGIADQAILDAEQRGYARGLEAPTNDDLVADVDHLTRQRDAIADLLKWAHANTQSPRVADRSAAWKRVVQNARNYGVWI